MSVESQFLVLVNRVTNSINILQGSIGVLGDLPTTDKTNLVNSLVELKTIIDDNYDAIGELIDDGTISSSTTWSSNKISNEISDAIIELIDGAPGSLDTLKELAAALQDDPAIINSIVAALAKRVRVDAVQAFTSGEKIQARSNIDAANVVHGHTTSDISGLSSTIDTQIGLASIDALADVTITTPISGQTLTYNGSAWVNTAYAFTSLTDTPGSYTGSGGYFVKVKSDETGLEFVDVIDGGSY